LESNAAQLDFREKHWRDSIEPQKLTAPTKLFETSLPCTEALLGSLTIYYLTIARDLNAAKASSAKAIATATAGAGAGASV